MSASADPRPDAPSRADLLFQASSALLGAVERDAMFDGLARLLVPALGDWCFVDLLEQGVWRRQCRVCADAADTARAGGVSMPWEQRRATGQARGRHDGGLLVVVADELARASGRRAGRMARVRDAGVRTYVRAPFSGGQSSGTITLLCVAPAGRQHHPADLPLVHQLAALMGQALENIERAEAAGQAARMRDQFLSSIAHDIANPLTALRLRTEVLLRQLRAHERVPRELLVERLELMLASTSAMGNIIDTVLDTARLQSGRVLDLERRRVDLVALTEQAVADRQSATSRHQIRVRAEAGPITGNWDGSRLRRVVDDLLSNAVKYSPAGGEILVTLRRETDGAGAWAVLAVQDPGIGIPPEDLPRLFTLFARGSNAVGRTLGRGIGLHSSLQIVEQHGGTIAVQSELDVGTTFEVRLPLDDHDGAI